MQRFGRKQVGHALGPFNDDNRAITVAVGQRRIGEDFFEAQFHGFGLRAGRGVTQAVGVNMHKQQVAFARAILVDERKGGAGDACMDAQAHGDPLCQGRFARAEIAAQRHNLPWLKRLAQLSPQFMGGFGGIKL
jgi:hypothetical protein